MNKTNIRVRFAPSPTGPLHIGGVRTALFNYLFAKSLGGDFILRIEDTDQNRFIPGTEEYIIEALHWLGLEFTEGPGKGGKYSPYRQSERKEKYVEHAERLIREDKAYYAFDTPEEIDSVRKEFESRGETFQYDSSTRMLLKNSLSCPQETEKWLQENKAYVIRFKIPLAEELKLNDLIRGEVIFNTSTLDDKVLFKSDGLPTYHLANVIDDYLMKISHVIRGEEWLPSLPLHVLLYKALGWEDNMPEFAHLPLILKPGGKGKLSKRDGDRLGFPVFPLQWTDPKTGEVSSGYREQAYLPEAVVNMLAFLGWNPGTDKEIYSLSELTEIFSLDRVGKSGSHFDPEKAKWYNQQYLRMKSDEEIALMALPVLKSKTIDCEMHKLVGIIKLIRERLSFASEIWENSSFFFQAPQDYDNSMIKKIWKSDTSEIIRGVSDVINNTEPFTAQKLEENITYFAGQKQLGLGKIMSPLRLLIVGSAKGPHLYDIITIIGREDTMQRIKNGLSAIAKE